MARTRGIPRNVTVFSQLERDRFVLGSAITMSTRYSAVVAVETTSTTTTTTTTSILTETVVSSQEVRIPRQVARVYSGSVAGAPVPVHVLPFGLVHRSQEAHPPEPCRAVLLGVRVRRCAVIALHRSVSVLVCTGRRGSVGEVRGGVVALQAGGGQAVGGPARPTARTFLKVQTTVLSGAAVNAVRLARRRREGPSRASRAAVAVVRNVICSADFTATRRGGGGRNGGGGGDGGGCGWRRRDRSAGVRLPWPVVVAGVGVEVVVERRDDAVESPVAQRGGGGVVAAQLQLQGGAGGHAVEVQTQAVGPALHAVHVLARHAQVVQVRVGGCARRARLLRQRVVVAVEKIDGQRVCKDSGLVRERGTLF